MSLASRRALAHLRGSDPVLADLMARVGVKGVEERLARDPYDNYGTLVRAIVGQQLSVAAASTIFGRLTARFGDRPPAPAEVLADDPGELRSATGLSNAKVAYLRSLAEHVRDGLLELDRLDELSDEEVIAALVAVKGIGLWSAQMFLIFHLQRPDVLPLADVGIQRAVRLAYGLEKGPTAAELERIGACWTPHRTLACLYLWRSLAATPS